MKNEAKNKNILTGTVVRRYGPTISVEIIRFVKHPKYLKYLKKSRVILAHDKQNLSGVGDRVEIIETRPISKRKSWKINRLLK